MASVLGRIQNFDHSLTPSEIKVANFLQGHPDDIINSSIHEVARRSGVSVASVSRLAVTLGYRDWKELRLNLVRDLNKSVSPVFSDIEEKDSEEAMIKKIFDCSMISLNDTFDQIDKQNVIRVASALESAGRVAFFGTGRSGCFAKEEALRFVHFDLMAEAYSDEYQMVLQSSMLRSGHVVFGFSNSGRSRATVNAMTVARKNKATTIGIANYRNTPLEAVSDIYFCTSFPRVGEISTSLTARIALLCIMDTIYVLCANRAKLGAKAEAVDKTIDKALRLSSRSRAAGPK